MLMPLMNTFIYKVLESVGQGETANCTKCWLSAGQNLPTYVQALTVHCHCQNVQGHEAGISPCYPSWHLLKEKKRRPCLPKNFSRNYPTGLFDGFVAV